MKRSNYYDYDFEEFYGDVNETNYDDRVYFVNVKSCYDTYTGHSDNYYDWN